MAAWGLGPEQVTKDPMPSTSTVKFYGTAMGTAVVVELDYEYIIIHCTADAPTKHFETELLVPRVR